MILTMAAIVTIASGATWQEVAADRQKYRDATLAAIEPAIPDFSSPPVNTVPIAKDILTAEEVKITESKVEELAPLLAKGELSAITVVKAFLRRAALAQKLVSTPRRSAYLLNQLILSLFRQTASPSSFPIAPSNAQPTSMIILKPTGSLLAPSTASP
jgi:hypothetical protein